MVQSESNLLLNPQNNRVTYKSKAQITLMVLNIALSSFYFGYCMVYFGQLNISSILDILSFDMDPNVAKGLLNGCIPVGGLFGALSSSILLNKLSRRHSLLGLNFCAIVVGGLLFIPNFYSLLLCRLLQGFFVGSYSAIVSLIIKQLSPTEISGTLGSYAQLFVCSGVTFGCFFAYILKKITGDSTGKEFWYYMYGFSEIPLVVQTIVLLVIFPYETPKYLLSVGREEEARQLLKVIYKDEFVEQMLQEKKIDLEVSTKNINLSEKESQQAKGTIIPVVVAIHLAALQQLSGVNAIVVYGGDIASNATTGELSSLMPTIINFEQIIAGLLTSLLLKRLGRKSILQVGTFLEGVGCLLVCIGFFIKNGSQDDPLGQGFILVGLFTFMWVFGVSLGPIVWLYIPEVVQPQIVPFSTATNWICASLVIILFPILTDNVLDSNPAILFLIFTLVHLEALLFNMKFMVETKDKTERAIQEEYASVQMC